MNGLVFVMYFVLELVLLALILDFVMGYRKGEGGTWQKFLSAGKNSASILAARVGYIGGLALQAIVEIADVVASPTVKAFIDQYVNAKAVGWTLIAAAFIAEIARRRTLTVPVIGQSGEGDK